MNADLSPTLCTDHAAQGWDHCDCSPARAMIDLDHFDATVTAYRAISRTGYHSTPVLTPAMTGILREAGYVLGEANPKGYLLGAESWDCPTCHALIGQTCYAMTEAESAKAYVPAHTARRDLASVRIA